MYVDLGEYLLTLNHITSIIFITIPGNTVSTFPVDIQVYVIRTLPY